MLVPICLLFCQVPTTIDLEVRASRLPVVIDTLAAKTNERLFCSPQLGRHVVLLKLTSVTPAEARQKIAEAVDAEWENRNGTLTLVRSAMKDRELKARWRAAQIKSYEPTLAVLFEQFDKSPKFTVISAQKLLADLIAQDERSKTNENGDFGDWYRLAIEHARGPGGRALTRVLRLLGAEGVADLPVGRTVLAIDPTNLQRPLNRAAKDVLRTWVEEQAVWQTALDAQPNEPRGMMLGTDPRIAKFGEGQVTRLLLIATKYGPKSNINFNLKGFNQVGGLVCQASISTNPPLFSPDLLNKANQLGNAKGTYTLSAEAMEKHSFTRLDYQNTKRPSLEWVKILSDPVTRDPLSFEHTEVLFALASEEKRNMVASLSDEMRIPTLDQPNPGPISLNGYLKYNEMLKAIEVAQDDRWILIKPWSQLGPPQLPEDRFAVRKLIQSGLANGYFSLEALGEHSLKADEMWNAASFYLARILLPRSERILQDSSVKALRFYGSLSPVQQRSLREGGSLELMALSPAAREALLQMLVNPDAISRYGGLHVDGNYIGGQLESDLSAEPTELFAGPSLAGDINSKLEPEDQLLVGTQNGKYVAWTRFIKPEQLASARKSEQGAYTKDDDYWLGTTVNLKLVIKLSKNAQLRLTLPEHRYDLRRDGVKLEALPADVRKKIEGG